MKSVIVGISGGVDSAVASGLLKKRGFNVIGITFKFTKDFDPTDAIKVAKKLGIEHHVLDYQEEFKEKIIDRFINDYKNGITPNPCVICNKYVKMKFLYEIMNKYNANYIATGHYANIKDGNLYESEDKLKDQTYFLCEVPKDILKKLILPLEGLSKDKVREIAKELGLEVASKKDSTDVCFINKNFKEYIKESIKGKPGKVIDINTKKEIGTHNGLFNYTIGQRRGLNIGGMSDRTFVVSKDMKNNILYVSVGDGEELISDNCILDNVNWFSDIKYDNCDAKFRYHAKNVKVNIKWLSDTKVLVTYKDGARAVTKGQACVFYDNNHCLGGGIITEVRKGNLIL